MSISGPELKELRNRLGLSVSQAAKVVHLADRSWQRYESGEREIPEAVVELFCIKNRLDYPIKENAW